jgi:hypothetical protein
VGEASERFAAAAELDRLHQHEAARLREPDAIGWLRRELGDPSAADAHHRAGLALARAQGARFAELCLLIESARDALALGALADAHERLELARVRLVEGELRVLPCNVQRAELRWHAARARCSLAAGDIAAAESTAARLLELAAFHPSHEHQALAHEQLARVALARGQGAQARAALELARAVLEAHPMPFVAWPVYALSAAVHTAAGESAAAARDGARARALIEQIAASVREPELAARFRASPAVSAALLVR